MSSTLLDDVLILYETNQWRQLLSFNGYSIAETRKLCWVWPSEKNLEFIREIIEKFHLNGVISVGCGCGFFEWLLYKCTGVPVIGYEINEEWWQSKYSNPQFIELKFPKSPLSADALPSEFALLFCYFNNGSAFIDYVNNYKGKLIFIIGPGNGAGRHTNPDPFNVDFGGTKWKLEAFQEVKQTNDFIAAYVKQ